jgi:hypothetical protein
MVRTRWMKATGLQVDLIMALSPGLRREAVTRLNRRDASEVISALRAGDSIEQYHLSGK